jgi:DNA-binding CsgD family transcriptional regulator
VTTTRSEGLAPALARAGRAAPDVASLATAVWTTIGRHVPFDFACLATTDPATGLISGAHKSRELGVGDEEWAALEYGGADVNLFADLALRPEPVGVLSIDTSGEPQQCRRFREFLAPRFGVTDELRVVFRADGLTWGGLAIHRGPGEPPFTAADARTVVGVHEQVAELLRAAVFDTSRPGAADPAAPAVVVVDAADRVVDITAAARERIDDLGGFEQGTSLPSTVLATTASARHTPALATTRVVGASGTWWAVRATRFASGDGVVVTIDAASASDIGTLALAARGLSSREQDVARLVLQGADTKAIAASLHLSPYTVQDHLKSIFGKLGVNSRREMVRRLVLA